MSAKRRAGCRRLGWGAILLPLAACAGPSFVPHPESGIELRWPNRENGIDAARAAAGARCAQQATAKTAVLAALFMDRDETLARFYCR